MWWNFDYGILSYLSLSQNNMYSLPALAAPFGSLRKPKVQTKCRFTLQWRSFQNHVSLPQIARYAVNICNSPHERLRKHGSSAFMGGYGQFPALLCWLLPSRPVTRLQLSRTGIVSLDHSLISQAQGFLSCRHIPCDWALLSKDPGKVRCSKRLRGNGGATS